MSESANRIEFEPGEVIKPDYNPENELVALVVTDRGLQSLREELCGGPESGESGPESRSGSFRGYFTGEAAAFDERLSSLLDDADTGAAGQGLPASLLAARLKAEASKWEAIAIERRQTQPKR